MASAIPKTESAPDDLQRKPAPLGGLSRCATASGCQAEREPQGAFGRDTLPAFRQQGIRTGGWHPAGRAGHSALSDVLGDQEAGREAGKVLRGGRVRREEDLLLHRMRPRRRRVLAAEENARQPGVVILL